MTRLWECCDCLERFREPYANVDMDSDLCPNCKSTDIKEVVQPACTACGGSGYHDTMKSPKCGACGGTGLRRQQEA